MKILAYLLFSLFLTAGLSVYSEVAYGEEFGAGYFLTILSGIVVSVLVGLVLGIASRDIMAVISFSIFALLVPFGGAIAGVYATLLAIVVMIAMVTSTVYLFLRVIGRIGEETSPRN